MQLIDPLSQLIESLAPTTEVFARVTAHAPWGVSEPRQDVCAFTYVLDGPCFLRVDDYLQQQLTPGQLLLLPRGAAHSVASGPDAECQDVDALFGGKSRAEVEQMVLGGDGEQSHILCGYIGFNSMHSHLPNLLTDSLPEVLVLNAPATCRLGQLLQWIYAENADYRAGQSLMLEKMLQMLLLEIIRTLDTLPLNPGVLNAVNDRHLAPAMQAIMKDLCRPWHLDQLADIAALSRSAFTSRFKKLTGLSCQAFIRHWRCQQAAQLLKLSDQPVASIGLKCGFQSSDVFIRNFRSFCGMTPNQFRYAANT